MLRLRRLVALAACVACLNITQPASAQVRLTRAQRKAFHAWIAHYWLQKWYDGLRAREEVGSGGPWVCIANAETGGRPAMGPTYWTVFGMVTGVITGYGTPAEQAHVFAGTATWSEQLDIGVRFASVNGFGGWGWLTRQKCGL